VERIIEKTTKWFAYILVCSDNRMYVGVTTNPTRRWHEHNFTRRGAKYTSRRRPVTPVWVAEIVDGNRSEAQKVEYFLKKNIRAKQRRMMIEDHNDAISDGLGLTGADLFKQYSCKGSCEQLISVLNVDSF